MTIRHLRSSALSLAGVALFTAASLASVIDVPATAPTIQDGINMAMPGDTVLVATGIYVEHLTLVSNVTLMALDPATTIISGGGVSQDVVSLTSVTNVVVSGFTIRGAISGGGLPGGAGVFVNFPSATITIQNCVLTGNDFGIAVFNGFTRFGPDILDCELHGNNFHGLSDPGNGLVARNLIYGNGHVGISVSGNSCSPTFDRNTIWGNTMGGFRYWNDRVPTLTSNIFASNGGYGFEETAPGTFVDPLLQSNLFFDNVAGNYYDVQTASSRVLAADIDMLPGVSGTIVADPMLCSPPMDFGLLAGSPAIGAGVGGVDIGARGLGCKPTCQAVGPLAPAAGDVQITLDITAGSPTVDVSLEFTTDMGASWTLCTPAATSPVPANPAAGLAVGMATFLWDTVVDGVGLGAVSTDVEVRSLITSVPTARCSTAPFDVLNRLCTAICGDCDLNQMRPTIIDALTAAQIAAGLIVPTPEQTACCDINDSGSLSVLDALGIAQSAAGIPVMLTCP